MINPIPYGGIKIGGVVTKPPPPPPPPHPLGLIK